MTKNRGKSNNKGIAIILTLSLLAFLVVFAEISWNYYISNNQLQKRYQNELQTLYEIEAAKIAVMWEEAHASSPNTWETINNTTCNLQGATIYNRFYRVPGFNFRARASFNLGNLNIRIHAFRGTESNPQYSQYLEYISVNSPLYQFAIFSNSDVDLPLDGYDNLFHLYGGKIHTNGSVYFWGWEGYYARLDQLKQLSATGTIAYSEGDRYPAPHIVDEVFDGARDGMAPAPAVTGDWAAYPTTAEEQDPGPFREYYDAGHGYTGIDWKWYGWWLGGDDIGTNPYMWRGEQSYFYGGTLVGNPNDLYYLKTDGTVAWDDESDNAVIHRYYLTDQYGTSLSGTSGKQQFELSGAYFRPYKDSQGNLVNDWYSVPTGLPQKYAWDKYDYLEENEQPVNFYVTERCTKGTTGCYADPLDPNPGSGGSWRYMKVSSTNQRCTSEACYNNPASQFVKAQNYTAPNGQPYFSNLNVDPNDKNSEFLSDYTYGQDANDPNSPYWQAMHFNTENQPLGYQQYSSLLAQNGVSDVLVPGAERKDMYLGNLFDTASEDSAYKIKAQENGLYIDASNVDNIISNLNQGGVQVAKKVSFYNWRTSQTITVLDIDIGKMKQQNKSPTNGIIYAKDIPLRFSNATNIPGTNSTDGKKAVFTVVSQESVYLKGDYNTEDWKVSNIATQKRVYTLSNAFSDPSSVPDFAVYLNYPYVFVKLDSNDKYIPAEGTPGVDNGEWLAGWEDYISEELSDWIYQTKENKQSAYESQAGLNPPNLVDNREDETGEYIPYTYNSLFITSYDIDARLENWHYRDDEGYEQQAYTAINGSVLDLYDSEDPEYSNYRATLSSAERSFNYRGRQAPERSYLSNEGAARWGSAPGRSMAYDARFPETIPNNFDATLGVTGINVWRIITQDYFNSHIELQ